MNLGRKVHHCVIFGTNNNYTQDIINSKISDNNGLDNRSLVRLIQT